MKITYLGHSCFKLDHEGTAVIVDPFLDNNPAAPLGSADITVDAILVTHGHADHLGDAVVIARRCACPVVASYELCQLLAEQGVAIEPMHVGGEIAFAWGTVKMTHALHGSAVETLGAEFAHGGLAGGYLVTMGGVTMYHAGDTGLFGDMKLLPEFRRIDVAALPIGDRFTMGPADARLAASWLRPRLSIPMHYNTFPPILQDGPGWVDSLKAIGLSGRAMQPGETCLVLA